MIDPKLLKQERAERHRQKFARRLEERRDNRLTGLLSKVLERTFHGNFMASLENKNVMVGNDLPDPEISHGEFVPFGRSRPRQ